MPGIGRTEDRRPPQSNNLFEEEENEDEVTYHEKMKFQEKLRHLSPEDLGQLVDVVIRKCPDAFELVDNDNAQLLLDNIELPLFNELNESLPPYAACSPA